MRTVVISCDRCGKVIEGYPVNIAAEYVDRDSGDFWPDSVEKRPDFSQKIAGRDFCEKCTEKIVRYALGGMKENEEFAKAVEDMVKNAPPDEPEKDAENNTPGSRSGKEKKSERAKIDTGKVMALTKAGWSAAQIADEMGIGVQAVYDARYRLKKEGNL